MDLKEFVSDKATIRKFFPFISRAPPKIAIQDNILDDGTRLVRNNGSIADYDFSQLRPETDADINQEINW